VIIPYRRFGTTFRSNFQQSRNHNWDRLTPFQIFTAERRIGAVTEILKCGKNGRELITLA